LGYVFGQLAEVERSATARFYWVSRSMGPGTSEALGRTDALLRLAQAQGAAPPPHAAAHWVSYGGGEALVLAIVLLVVAGGFTYAGKRLRPARSHAVNTRPKVTPLSRPIVTPLRSSESSSTTLVVVVVVPVGMWAKAKPVGVSRSSTYPRALYFSFL
jgi:hypothetical protein